MTTINEIEKTLDRLDLIYKEENKSPFPDKPNQDWLIETCRKLIAQNRVMKESLHSLSYLQHTDGYVGCSCPWDVREALAEVERLEGEE